MVAPATTKKAGVRSAESREQQRQYYARPEIKAARAEYRRHHYARPEVQSATAEQRRQYRARPEIKAAREAQAKAYRARPEVKAARAEYRRQYLAEPENRERKRQGNRQYRARPEVKAALARHDQHGHHRRAYGLTPEAHAALATSCGNLCSICRQPPGGRGLYVDHNHASGKVRALLCQHCNCGLGHFRDDPARLRAAAAYLEFHANTPPPAATVAGEGDRW